jgi:hypothetical protein
MHFTLRHGDVDDGGSLSKCVVDFFCSFPRRFFTSARTQAFAALTTNGRFLSLSKPAVQVFRTTSVLVQTSPIVHTDSILGYRHISACLCAPLSLTARPSSCNLNRE